MYHEDRIVVVRDEIVDAKECVYLRWMVNMSQDVVFWPFDPAKNAIQGDAPEGGDTF